MSVLIITAPRDVHARAVQWALKKRGIRVELLMYGDYPQFLSITERLGVGGPKLKISHKYIGSYGQNFGALWRRRLGSPMIGRELHPSDSAAALKESQSVIEALEGQLDAQVKLSVNSYRGHILAKKKPVQLRAAEAVGFKIPDTLISNSPKEILEFYKFHNGNVVLKPFTAPSWKAKDRSYFTFTQRLPESVVFDVAALESAPAIYQEMINKHFEVRAFFAGRSYLAAKLNSQKTVEGAHDWRRAGTENLDIEPIHLPNEVIQKCWEFMDELGIVTGSFDFAVATSGEYVFFEVNEQGQFLWLEQRCPSLPALEMFTEFLVSCDPEFEYRNGLNHGISFADYQNSGAWDQTMTSEQVEHIVADKKSPYIE